MKPVSFLAAVSGLAISLLTSAVMAQNIMIHDVRLTGTGCSNSSASATSTEDGKILSVLFDNYAVEIGNGSTNPQAITLKRDCRILIDIDVTPGYAYALESTEYRGYTALPANAYGMHRFTQIIPGQPIVSVREASLTGPINQNYSVLQRQKPGRYVYSQCNKPRQTLEIMSELMVAYKPKTTGRDIAMINLDSVDTGVTSSFNLVWQKCK